jgi:putative membrane protein
MKWQLGGVILGLVCVIAATARADDQDSKMGPDQQFVLKVSAGGMAEVNMGNVAVERGASEEVKKFGRHMVKDHTKANKELADLANKKGLKVATDADAEQQKKMSQLLKLDGPAFDREYMMSQIKDHKEVIALFEKQMREGQDEDLKKWAGETLPRLREHLKMAEEIHGKLEGAQQKRDPDK